MPIPMKANHNDEQFAQGDIGEYEIDDGVEDSEIYEPVASDAAYDATPVYSAPPSFTSGGSETSYVPSASRTHQAVDAARSAAKLKDAVQSGKLDKVPDMLNKIPGKAGNKASESAGKMLSKAKDKAAHIDKIAGKIKPDVGSLRKTVMSGKGGLKGALNNAGNTAQKAAHVAKGATHAGGAAATGTGAVGTAATGTAATAGTAAAGTAGTAAAAGTGAAATGAAAGAAGTAAAAGGGAAAAGAATTGGAAVVATGGTILVPIGIAILAVICIVLLLSLILGVGACTSSIFSGDSNDGQVIEQEGLFIPKVKMADPKGTCDDSDSGDKKTGNGSFETYSFTDDQVMRIAAVCQREQGSPKGAAAEASLMANLFLKKHADQVGDANAFFEWLKVETWFGGARTKALMEENPPKPNGEDLNPDVVAAVKEVLVNGKHTLPKYVDEHDCYNPPDIESISTGSPTNPADYKQHETIIKNIYGATYTFYCFPEEGSDPFGYIDASKREEYGDDCYTFEELGVGSEAGSDSASTSSDSSSSNKAKKRVTEKEDCIDVDTSNTVLGEWAYYNQCSPNWDVGSEGASTWMDGCGVVSYAMVIASYSKDPKYTPSFVYHQINDPDGPGQYIQQGRMIPYVNDRPDIFHLKMSEGTSTSNGWKENWDRVVSVCKAGGCVIVGQNTISTNSGSHYIVVRKVENGTVTYADPATGAEGTYEEEKFKQLGYSANNTQAIWCEKI